MCCGSLSFLLEIDFTGLVSLLCFCCVKSFVHNFIIGMFYILAYLSIPSRKIWYQNQANDIIYRTLTTPGGVQSLAEQATVLECTRGFRSTIRKIFSLISYLSSCVGFFSPQIEIQPQAASFILETLICF